MKPMRKDRRGDFVFAMLCLPAVAFAMVALIGCLLELLRHA